MRFEPVKIEDKAEFDALLSQRRYENSWLTFGNLFTWRHAFGTEWERLPEGIRIRFVQEGESLFLPPLVTAEASFAAAVDSLAEELVSAGKKFRFLGLSEEMAAEVEGVFPGKFAAEAKRDRYDYLYKRRGSPQSGRTAVSRQKKLCEPFSPGKCRLAVRAIDAGAGAGMSAGGGSLVRRSGRCCRQRPGA